MPAETGASRSLSATVDDAGPMMASTPPVMSESKPIAADAAVAPSSASINLTSEPMTPPAALICSVAACTASTIPSPNNVAPGAGGREQHTEHQHAVVRSGR